MVKIGLHVCLILFLGTIFSQLPGFSKDYDETLIFSLERLEAELEEIDRLAAAREITRYDYIEGLLNSNDPAIRTQGEFYLDQLSRRQNLVNSAEIFARSTGADAFLILLLHFDGKVMLDCLSLFRPKFELSVIFFGYLMTGMGIGYLIPIFPRFFRTRYIPIPSEFRLDQEDEEDQLRALFSETKQQPKKLEP